MTANCEPLDELMQSLLGDFLDESNGLIAQLGERALLLEAWALSDSAARSPAPSSRLLNEMFRAAHGIKGLSGMMRFDDVNRLTHKLENILDAARTGDLTVTGDVMHLIFQAINCLEQMVAALAVGDTAGVEYELVHCAIDQLLKKSGVARQATTQADAERVLRRHAQSASAAACTTGPAIPPAEAPKQLLPPIAAELRPANDSGALKTRPNETLRVDIARLDKLMELAGQLIANKSRFTQIGERLPALLANAESVELVKAQSWANDFVEAVAQLGCVSDCIQTAVMETRLVPVGRLFMRFNRLVRDLSHEALKEIALEISGETTELDKRMIDELSEPLIHLIRNATDHGIESPHDRLAAGKPSQGSIRLKAVHSGSRFVVELSDDGRGLDMDRIRRTAIARGLVSETDAAKLSPWQIQRFIWQPGFSTAERVTEVSGRGVGMDIVWSKIEQLNGTIDMTSEPGQGTTFVIKLPLTVAIVPSLLMAVDGEIFAAPVDSVVEIERFKNADIKVTRQGTIACLRDRASLPLVDLYKFSGQKVPKKSAVQHEVRQDATIVVVGVEGREVGLIVDNLIGKHAIVVESLAERSHKLEGVAGTSLLVDGRTAFVLDLGALIEMSDGPALSQFVPE